MNDVFHKFSSKMSRVAGSSTAFIVAITVVCFWGLSGVFFNYSDTWQLVINTGTTIVTFLMVFLIQNTQNRDSKAMHIKLDELLKTTKGARNALVDSEDLSDEELEKLQQEFKVLHEHYANELVKRGGKKDTK